MDWLLVAWETSNRGMWRASQCTPVHGHVDEGVPKRGKWKRSSLFSCRSSTMKSKNFTYANTGPACPKKVASYFFLCISDFFLNKEWGEFLKVSYCFLHSKLCPNATSTGTLSIVRCAFLDTISLVWHGCYTRRREIPKNIEGGRY